LAYLLLVDSRAALIFVSGLVQGVGFRYFVQRKAISYGLRGFVRNAYNGTVEIVVVGAETTIQELIDDVRIGPRSAHVVHLQIQWEAPREEYHGFEIR